MALTKPKLSHNIDTDISVFSDPILVLHQGATSADVDVGFLMNRSNGLTSNAAVIWQESTRSFVHILTNDSGAPNSNLTVQSYANVSVGNVLLINNAGIYVNGTIGDAGQVLASDGTKTFWAPPGGFTGGIVSDPTVFQSNLVISSTTDAIDSTSGALVVLGGVGINGNVYLNSNYIQNIADPLAAQDAATKNYVDSQISGFSTTTIANGAASVTTIDDGGYGNVQIYGNVLVDITGTSNVYVGGNIFSSGNRVLTLHDLTTVTTTANYITMNPGSVDPAITSPTYPAASATYGTYNFGSLADIQTYGDYDELALTGFYSVNDATGAPGAITYIGFTNVSNFNRVVFNVNYTAASGHTQDVDIYNYNTSQWDTLGQYSGSGSWQTLAYGIISDTPYISNTGNVTLRNYHLSTGNVSHRTWLDYVALEQSITGGSGPRGPQGATGPAGTYTGGYVSGITTFGSNLVANSGTTSTSVTTGALVVVGGAGISGNLYIANAGDVSANLGTIKTNLSTLDANVGTITTSLQTLNANVGAYEIYANANIGTIKTNLSTLDANVGAYEIYANANIGTITTSLQTLNANVGAFQTYSNANAVIQDAAINSLATGANANIAAYLLAPGPIGTTTPNTGKFTGITATGSITAADGTVTASNLVITDTVSFTKTGSGAVFIAGNTSIGANVDVTGKFRIDDTTDAVPYVMGSGALHVAGGMSIGKDIWVGGNLYVANIVSETSTILKVNDPLVYLNSDAAAYNYDIGMFSDFQGGSLNIYQYTGAARSYQTNEWIFFSNLNTTPSSGTIGFTSSSIIYDPVKVGNLVAANTTPSTSTNTGALIVKGGAGIAGNLNVGNNFSLTGTGKRITGNFSDATISNRVLFQTSVTDSYTSIGVVPNGSSTSAQIATYTGTTANESSGYLNIVGGYGLVIAADRLGTGDYLPMYFYAGGTARVVIDPADGSVAITSTEDSTSTGTGALAISGGLGVAGNVYADKFYTTTGLYWAGNGVAFSSGSSGGSVTYTANTAPPVSGNVKGDQWYNTSTDTLFEYLDDGTNQYWIDVQSLGQTTNVSSITESVMYGNISVGLGNVYTLGSSTGYLKSVYSGNVVANTVFVSGSINWAGLLHPFLLAGM